jgi:hypothetical protein
LIKGKGSTNFEISRLPEQKRESSFLFKNDFQSRDAFESKDQFDQNLTEFLNQSKYPKISSIYFNQTFDKIN